MTSHTRPHTVVVIRPTGIHSTASRRSQMQFRKRCPRYASPSWHSPCLYGGAMWMKR